MKLLMENQMKERRRILEPGMSNKQSNKDNTLNNKKFWIGFKLKILILLIRVIECDNKKEILLDSEENFDSEEYITEKEEVELLSNLNPCLYCLCNC